MKVKRQMGIGPMGSSLLSKLGIKGISELSTEELRKLVSNDRLNRTLVRAAGRIKRIQKDEKTYSPRPITLESIGLAPTLIAKLRAGGRSDGEIIKELKEKGVL